MELLARAADVTATKEAAEAEKKERERATAELERELTLVRFLHHKPAHSCTIFFPFVYTISLTLNFCTCLRTQLRKAVSLQKGANGASQDQRDLEVRMRTMTEHIINNQSVIDRLSSEKHSLQVQLESLQKQQAVGTKWHFVFFSLLFFLFFSSLFCFPFTQFI